MTVTAAVACVLTSTILYPLFYGGAWLGAGIGAASVVAACGALTRLRTLPVPVCLAGTLLGLLLYLNAAFEADRSLLLIPTAASLSALWHLAGTGLHEASKYASPAPDLAGLVLLAGAGIGITAVLTDLIAVRLRCAALAGLPLLVLFTVPVTMNASHSQAGTALVFCLAAAGYLAMLGADGRERIRVWGRLVSLWQRKDKDHPGISGPDVRVLAAAGRRVGLASIVLALFVPLIVPGLHASKLFSSGPGIGGTGPGTATAPGLPDVLSQALAELRQPRPEVVLAYRTTAPANIQQNDPQYLRMYVLDTLTSSGWQNADYQADATSATSMPHAQGLTRRSAAVRITTTVQAENFGGSGPQLTLLPVPYPPTAVRVEAPGHWMADPDLMVFSQDGRIAGRSYTVQSLAVDPTKTQLEQAPPPAALAADLQLPPSYQAPALKRLAEEVTARDRSEFAKADTLALWLSGPQFRYSTAAPSFDTASGLLSFLTETKAGVCVQSAYAMTVLARLLGIPARMAVGYTAGAPTRTPGSYVVKNTDAHAWTEVFFTGYGWIRFEPTPSGQGTAAAPGYMNIGTGQNGYGILPALPSAGPTGNADIGGYSHKGTQAGDTGPRAAGGGPASGRAATPWAAVALAVIAAIALACGIIAVVSPQAARAPSARPAGAGRRRQVTATAAALAAAAAGVVALVLYRLLSHGSAPDLRDGWATVGIAFGAACVLLLAVPALARAALRRWRWLVAADDASRAHAAWREFRDDLADFGIGCPPSEPPRTLAERVCARLPETASDAARRIALAEERARYAARPAPSEGLRRDGMVARRGIAAAAPYGARWRARAFPASLLSSVADGTARIGESAAAVLTGRRAERAR
ncbi:MAG: transglutaminase domain-containing protein [Streptosporangiaceae bacterium]|nr:transglutaminase domain-containing protein [Streptosporangiaceae bacterium]